MTFAVRNKPPAYYDVDRTPFLDWVGPVAGRTLEIGCGTGRNALAFRANGATEILGVEPNAEAAEIARKRFDRVYALPIEQALSALDGTFDLIVCCDVLEHLLDPWTVVAGLRRLTTPDTVLAISIPNVRYFRALWSVGFGAGFDYPLDGTYDPHSIFDTTHIRFFTRSNVASMLDMTEWRPMRWGVPPRRRLKRLRSLIDLLTRGALNEWLTYQWYVAARPRPRSGPP